MLYPSAGHTGPDGERALTYLPENLAAQLRGPRIRWPLTLRETLLAGVLVAELLACVVAL